MNNKRISVRGVFFAALAVCAHQAMAQVPSSSDAAAQTASAAGQPTASAARTGAAPVGSLRLVEQENAGRDAQGHMRIQLINGGIKLPAKL